jgi:tetratricopeptide (TPR) repeat protein
MHAKEPVSNATQSPAAPLPDRHIFVACLCLVAATLIVYRPIVHNGFLDYDDLSYIQRNVHVLNGVNWEDIRWAFTAVRNGNWHPLTWLSHALDCQLFALNPVGHHYTSLLFHAANAVLLFLLLWRATKRTWPSLLAAALFALHPLNVESVAWASERKNVLSMFFCLLTLLAYDRYVRRGGWLRYLQVVLLFALGLMAKSQIVTLPFILLLWDYWPAQRRGTPLDRIEAPTMVRPRSITYLLWEKVPLMVMAAVDSVVTVLAQRAGDSVRTLDEFPLSLRLENVVLSYVRYLGKICWPVRLAPLYPRPVSVLPEWQLLALMALLLLMSAVALRWCHIRYLPFGWFWFLGTLVPMIGLITVGEQAMADRYAYLPMIGVLVAVVWMANEIVSSFPAARWGLAAIALIALCLLGYQTQRQIAYWHDDETLWRYTLSVTEGNYVAHNNLALALARNGKSDEAITEFHASMGLHHYPPSQILTFASFELESGHPQASVEDCRSVLRESADAKTSAAAWSGIGQAQLVMRQYDLAAESYQNSLRLNPDDSVALLGSGVLALRKEQLDVAVAQLARSLKGDNNDVAAVLLAQALRRGGRKAEADSVAAQVQRLSQDPHHAQTAAEQFLAFAGLKPI